MPRLGRPQIMIASYHRLFRTASLVALCVAARPASDGRAQSQQLAAIPSANAAGTGVRLTVEEAKQRALANNKLLNIGGLNAEGKAFAVRAAQSDYFPKVVGNVLYM